MNKRKEPGQSQIVEQIQGYWTLERPDLDISDFLLAINLMRLGRRIDHVYDRMCRERFGISGGDMRVLFALRRAGPPYSKRPTDLFQSTLVTSGAITKQVDRLSRLGFVKRTGNPSGARGIMVQLTNRGFRASDEATEILVNDSVITPATRAMSARQRAQFQRGVADMLAVCESSPTQPRNRAGHKPRRKTRKKSNQKNSKKS